MPNNRIPRRAVVPGLAFGATAALSSTAAAQSPAARFIAFEPTYIGGPCGLWREQTLRISVFLPAVQSSARIVPSRFRLMLSTIDGKTIVSQEFSLAPGTG